MLRIFNDPLLSVTQGLLRVAYVALFSVAVLLGIAACFGLTLADQVAHYTTATTVERHDGSILVLALVPTLALFGWFVRILSQIVGSVAAGTPFIADNADRLTRMAWLALALKAISLVQQMTLSDTMGIKVTSAPTGGVVLALTLFILARVFRQGAAMREDLEGTV